MCENKQTGKLPLSVIDHVNRHLIKLRALADLLGSIDPIELESRTMEGTSLIITDCTEAIHQILTSAQPDNREDSE
jgi:hypothetical protein